MIKKGDYLVIKPEWRDAGDEAFTWVARSDEQCGQVDIFSSRTGPPTTVASTDCAQRLKKATKDARQIEDPSLTDVTGAPCVKPADPPVFCGRWRSSRS